MKGKDGASCNVASNDKTPRKEALWAKQRPKALRCLAIGELTALRWPPVCDVQGPTRLIT
jgi:hypothetical protein